jgi:hypothetical protein
LSESVRFLLAVVRLDEEEWRKLLTVESVAFGRIADSRVEVSVEVVVSSASGVSVVEVSLVGVVDGIGV